MRIRRVVTENTTWIFDLDLKRYIRIPNNENPTHPSVPYTGQWDDYTTLEKGGGRINVHRPVPFGTGAIRQTGIIISDSEEGVDDKYNETI